MAGLTPDLLLQAYAVGLFPMAERKDDPSLYWIDPELRGVLPLDAFHLPRRLARTVRSNRFDIRCNTAFEDVIKSCAEPGTGRAETWINAPILQLYTALFHRGQAHSVEAWREGRLVGGLYGVSLGGAFFGESMFSRETDASKVTLVHLVARLIEGGYTLLDCQFQTDHLRQFGVVEIGREEYRDRLARALKREARFQRVLAGDAVSIVRQRTTHTS